MIKKPKLEVIEGGDTLLGIDRLSDIIAGQVVEDLGKGPEASSVTHHDVRRAAVAAAKKALEFYDNNAPVNRDLRRFQ